MRHTRVDRVWFETTSIAGLQPSGTHQNDIRDRSTNAERRPHMTTVRCRVQAHPAQTEVSRV